MTKKIVSIIMALVILSVSVISFATSEQELQNKVDELNEKIEENNERMDEIKGEQDATMKELETLNSEIEEKEDEIDNLNRELSTLSSEISTLETQLKEEQQKYDEQYDLLCRRILAQYKAGKTSFLDVILNSSSLSDFVSRYYFVEMVAEFDENLLNTIKTKKTEIENSKNELDKKKESLSEKQTQLNTEQKILTNKKANKNKYIAQLSDEQKEIQKQNDEYLEERKKAEREAQEIARQNALSAPSGYTYSGGQLAVPCNYTRISSYFGYRGSAATGGVGSSNHKGMDFAAPKGTTIVSADTGVVIKVSNTCTHNYAKTASTRCHCGGGFGNYIMISHGGGLVTLYGHCTSINVNVGDTVSRAQPIGTVGCTGYSTGNHLHFSVLLNGTYVNPAPYLGK